MIEPLVRAPGPEMPDGFREVVSSAGDAEVGLTLATWKHAPGGRGALVSEESETAVLALGGTGILRAAGRTLDFARSSWLEDCPTVIHCPAQEPIEACNTGTGPLELLVVQTPNARRFAPRYYTERDIGVEQRGKGILGETCHRIVRLAFDDTNGPPESNLVLGEVVNFAGRWSSYPPHHHPQPEIYYYRFDPPQGYGHGELGDAVFKIRTGDLLAITGDRSHCQVSAPGYTMYYLWAVRHLAGSRYRGFTFEPEHAWTLEPR